VSGSQRASLNTNASGIAALSRRSSTCSPTTRRRKSGFVHVFALTVVKDDQQLFVARPAPVGKAANNTTLCIISQAHGAPPPAITELTFSMPLEIAKKVLSRFTGIDPSVRLPVARSVRQLSPSVRHGLFFCLQEQNEVANQNLLFHGQSEEFHRPALRAMLPYFLGAVDPERAQREHQLKLLRRQLAEAQERQEAAQPFRHASGTAAALFAEAVEANLLDPAPSGRLLSHDEIVARLRLTEPPVPHAAPVTAEDPLSELNAARRDLRQAYAQTRVRISNLKAIAREKDDFLGQVHEQHARLATLGLLPQARAEMPPQQGLCPVCGSHAPDAGQATQIMRQDLERLDAEMTTIGEATPDINARITEEEEALADLRSALARNQEEIEVFSAGQRATAQNDSQHRAAVVQGRISLFLDAMARHTQAPPAVDRREELTVQIAELEDQLANTVQEDLLSSHLSLVNQKIQAKATALELEHHDEPIRLDPQALTLIADTRPRPTKMSEMGSGQNYLGYHIATMLSLHEWFAEINSPVPRFLILDQPSQAGFPDETRDGGFGTARATLLNLYKTIHASVAALQGGFQVIVVEHADLDDEPFRSAVRARWRRSNGEALVPEHWITYNTDE
jgi:hypothetical protein